MLLADRPLTRVVTPVMLIPMIPSSHSGTSRSYWNCVNLMKMRFVDLEQKLNEGAPRDNLRRKLRGGFMRNGALLVNCTRI
jgi:hypothetical protein